MAVARKSREKKTSIDTQISLVEAETSFPVFALVDTCNFSIDKILINPIFQPRNGLNQDAIAKYADILSDELLVENKSNCPPVDILKFNDFYYLIHGHHRYEAFKACNCSEIPANIWSGSWDRAIQFACQANIFNGLQLSRKEVAIACRRYLEVNDKLPENQRESDRAIARRFLVDPKSVRNYRKQNEAALAVMNWEEGITILRYKPVVEEALKPFSYATYAGFFNPEDGTAEFEFCWPGCCTHSNTHNVLDFEVVDCIPEEHKLESSSELKVGSVIWADYFFGWSVVCDIEYLPDGARYWILSWKCGLTKVLSGAVLSLEQASAIDPHSIPFFSEMDLEELISMAIARIQELIQVEVERIRAGEEPLIAQEKINRHERDIVILKEILQKSSIPSLAQLGLPNNQNSQSQSDRKNQDDLDDDGLGDDDWGDADDGNDADESRGGSNLTEFIINQIRDSADCLDVEELRAIVNEIDHLIELKLSDLEGVF